MDRLDHPRYHAQTGARLAERGTDPSPAAAVRTGRASPGDAGREGFLVPQLRTIYVNPLVAIRCPRPYCGGKLMAGANGTTCYLCGRGPQPEPLPIPVLAVRQLRGR